MQTIHIFGQRPFRVKHPLTIEDLRAVAHFNKIIKNYHKMLVIEKSEKR